MIQNIVPLYFELCYITDKVSNFFSNMISGRLVNILIISPCQKRDYISKISGSRRTRRIDGMPSLSFVY